MMGERSGSQGGFSTALILRSGPSRALAAQDRHSARSLQPAITARAALQPYRAALDRSGADDPDAADRLLLRHPIGAPFVRGSASELGLPLVL